MDRVKIHGSSQYGSSAKPEQEVKPGIYKHYKGDEYEVYGVFTHRDTGQKIVCYKGLSNDGMMEFRYLDDFTSTVGQTDVARFVFVRDLD